MLMNDQITKINQEQPALGAIIVVIIVKALHIVLVFFRYQWMMNT